MGEQSRNQQECLKKQLEINLEFAENICLKFEQYCKRNTTTPTHELFIKFLIQRSIIRERDVTQYMAIELYSRAMYENNGVKTQAVYWLEDKLPTSERTIWGWIGANFRRFMPHKKPVFPKDIKDLS